jgi:hypothetical protein
VAQDGPVRRYEGFWMVVIVDVCGGMWFCGAWVVVLMVV